MTAIAETAAQRAHLCFKRTVDARAGSRRRRDGEIRGLNDRRPRWTRPHRLGVWFRLHIARWADKSARQRTSGPLLNPFHAITIERSVRQRRVLGIALRSARRRRSEIHAHGPFIHLRNKLARYLPSAQFLEAAVFKRERRARLWSGISSHRGQTCQRSGRSRRQDTPLHHARAMRG